MRAGHAWTASLVLWLTAFTPAPAQAQDGGLRPGQGETSWAPALWSARFVMASIPPGEPRVSSWAPLPAIPTRGQDTRGPSVAGAAALSAVLPGAGQHLLGQRRTWLYLAVEALGWGLYIDRRAAGADFRDRYRDFAWSEARIRTDPRVDGDFDYYETLTSWERSGAFDIDPAATGLQPEDDASTYNGSIWSRARSLYLPGGSATPVDDPQYQRAITYYRARAYDTLFLWDWTGTGNARATYAGLIRQSDDRFRQATNVMGVIIANHAISAVDAFLSARGLALPADTRFAPHMGPSGTRWMALVRLETP